MPSVNLETKDLEMLQQRMTQYQGDAEDVINKVLHKTAGPMIEQGIMRLLPESGRNWKGKKRGAKRAAPFSQIDKNLEVDIKTKSNYNYLYFPDDGSNTRKHYGNKHFMINGAENNKEAIIDQCVSALVEDFE